MVASSCEEEGNVVLAEVPLFAPLHQHAASVEVAQFHIMLLGQSLGAMPEPLA